MDGIIQGVKGININVKNIKKSTIKYRNGYTQIVRTNDDKNLDGNQELYDENNNLKSFDQYDNGVRNGYSRKYINKTMISEHQYDNGKLNGTCREWNENGDILSSIDYKDDKFHGDHIVFIEPHNQLRYKEYRNGKLHGNDIAVEGDVKVMEMTYKNNVPYGKRINRHSNGRLRCEVEYVNGQANGDVIEYDENGRVESKMRIINGRYTGTI